jgi:perosamine synthetase
MKRTIAISLPSTGEDEWLAVKEPLMTGWLTQGPQVTAFENAFAKRHNVKHALATTSCTTGLHLILAAMGIGPGDEVIVPAFTWVATANVVLYTGATPVFADVDPKTYNIKPDEIARHLSSKTKAIIVVHLFGLCADMNAIRDVTPSHVKIIEDAACAAGASYQNICAGGLGDAAAFSFHPRKSITTGEGGMVTTNDEQLAETANRLRNHGAEISEEQRHKGPRPYLLPEFNLLGFNYRMTDLQGAVGLVQLGKLDQFIAERQHWADWYAAELKNIPWLQTPDVPQAYSHAWQAYVTSVDPQKAPFPRNEIMERLQQHGIATRPGTHAVHMLNFYRDRFKLCPEDYPGALACDENTMAIPLHNRMVAEDYAYVVEALKEIN